MIEPPSECYVVMAPSARGGVMMLGVAACLDGAIDVVSEATSAGFLSVEVRRYVLAVNKAGVRWAPAHGRPDGGNDNGAADLDGGAPLL